MNDSILKPPPNSMEAEQNVLGALMLGASYDSVSAILAADDFYHPTNRVIFVAMGLVAAKGEQIDLLTVSDKLETTKELDAAGGIAYLAELAKNTPSVSNCAAYARVIRDRALQRDILLAGIEISRSVYDETLTTDEKIAAAQATVLAIDSAADDAEAKPVSDALLEIIARIDEREKQPGLLGLTTSYPDIDHYFKGMRGGRVYVIAGRPGFGKSTLAMNIAEHAAEKHRVPVLVFSLEMTREELTERMICSLGRVSMDAIDNGKLSSDDWHKIADASRRIKEMPIHICDRPGLTIARIRAIARFQKRVNNTGMIVIDHLGLVRTPKSKEANRNQELGEVSRQIKEMAKELNVPVLQLCQLNRAIESRADKTPTMSDIRDSGEIEQDADTIAFLHRDNRYPWTNITIGKNRGGKTGGAKLMLHGDISRFESYSDTPHPTSAPVKTWDEDYDR